jgi:hypothetical protein
VALIPTAAPPGSGDARASEPTPSVSWLSKTETNPPIRNTQKIEIMNLIYLVFSHLSPTYFCIYAYIPVASCSAVSRRFGYSNLAVNLSLLAEFYI